MGKLICRKIWPEFFKAIDSEEKTFEVRNDDRKGESFEVGDTLQLEECDPSTKEYTGKVLRRVISYVLNIGNTMWGHNTVVLGLSNVHPDRLKHTGPGHDPTGEGSAYQPEAIAKPVGWLELLEGIQFGAIPPRIRRRTANGLLVYPDPSIPWGKDYEAILPEEAMDGASWYHPGIRRWCSYEALLHSTWGRNSLAWRRLKPTQGTPVTNPTAKVQEIQEGAAHLPEPWNEESSRRILALVDERDRYRDLATRKTTEAEDNLVRAVLAERELANLKADLTKMIKEDACWCVRRSPPATVSEWAT